MFGFDYDRASFILNAAKGNRKSNASRNSIVVDPFSDIREKEHIPGFYSKLNVDKPLLPLQEPQSYEGNLDPYGGDKLMTVADNDPGWLAWKAIEYRGRVKPRAWTEKQIELMLPTPQSNQARLDTTDQSNQDHPNNAGGDKQGLPNIAKSSNQVRGNNAENSSQDHPNNAGNEDKHRPEAVEDNNQDRAHSAEHSHQDRPEKVEDEIKEASKTVQDQQGSAEDEVKEASDTAEDQPQIHPESAKVESKEVSKVEDQPQIRRETANVERKSSSEIIELQPQTRPRNNSDPVTGLEVIPEDAPKKLGKGGSGMKKLADITKQVELVTSHAKGFKYKLDTRWFGLARKSPEFVVALRALLEMLRPFMLELTMGALAGWRLFRGVTQERIGAVYDKVIPQTILLPNLAY